MNTEIKYINNLIKAKTKYAIASALDYIHPFGKFTILVDSYSKMELIQKKFNTLNKLDSHLRELRKRNAGIKSDVEKYSQAIINIDKAQWQIIESVKGV